LILFKETCLECDTNQEPIAMRKPIHRRKRKGTESVFATDSGIIDDAESPLDKAKRWLETGVKSTALVVVPLAAITVSGQTTAVAGTIFNPTSASFFVASGGGVQATTGFGALPSFNSITGATAFGNAQYDVSGFNSLEIGFRFAGNAGEGSTPFAASVVPISWNFTFTPASSSDTWSYSAITDITTANSDTDTSTSQNFGSYVGQASISDSMIAATPMGLSMTSWDTTLVISWQSGFASGGAGSGMLNWDIPSGQSLDINFGGPAAVPEPSTWQLVIAPLLVGLGMLLRHRRQGSNETV
jgi:hypothetical protein